MELKFLIVWVLSGIMFVFIFYFYTKRIRIMRKNKKVQQQILMDKQDRFSYLKEGELDKIDHTQLDEAVLFSLIRKENEDDDFYEHFNHSQRLVHGIYQLNQAMQGKNPNIVSFFDSPATRCYVDDIQDYFEEIGAHQIHDLLVALKRLIEIIENDLDDEEDDPLMGMYSRYNYTDFTQEYISLLSTLNVIGKIRNYISDHKEDFYDTDIPNVESEEE